MTDHVPVHRLFETHLTMSDLQRSIVFYRDVVGLRLSFEASAAGGLAFVIYVELSVPKPHEKYAAFLLHFTHPTTLI